MLSILMVEGKKCGVNVVWITSAALIAFTLLCISGGDLADWPILGFEVILPFLCAILVCEWVQTLSDPMIDVISVHSKSLFKWVVGRFVVVMGISCSLCIVCLIGLRLWVFDFSIAEIFYVFMTTTMFFTSIGIFSSFLSRQSHVSAAVCGIIWLLSLMIRSLTRFTVIAYVYPFLRFVDANAGIWLVNKLVLLTISIFLWSSIYLICKINRFR